MKMWTGEHKILPKTDDLEWFVEHEGNCGGSLCPDCGCCIHCDHGPCDDCQDVLCGCPLGSSWERGGE